QNILSQVDVQQIIQPISFQLENDDFDEIEKAERLVKEANQMGEDLVEEDQRLEKYFAKKEKKGEKKALYAKQYRIDRTKKYIDGLSKLHEVLNERLNFAIFEYPEDQSSVNGLRNESDDLFGTAKQNFSFYEGLDKKELKKGDYGYYAMISEFDAIVQICLSGIDKQIDSYAIWASQTEKKQKELADESGWANAKSMNTIDGYKEYLSAFPKGKYREQANIEIDNLKKQALLAEEQARLAAEREQARLDSIAAAEAEAERLRLLAEQDQGPTGLFYSVQIMAVYFQVDSARICEIYNGEGEVAERFEDGMYKYSVGEFATFEEAREFRKTLSIPSFIVAFQDGERIPTLEARKMQEPKEETEMEE
ncbi:hypothetical protein ACFLTE_12295, partial [Bacteroidota bacterium]